MFTGVIYKAANTINNKCYIGRTFNMDQRKNCHKYRAYHNNTPTYNNKFQCAIRKYGWDSFDWEILFEINGEDKVSLLSILNEKEQYFVKFYDSYVSGYNMTEGGEGTAGYNHTEETRKLQSEMKQGMFVKEKNPFYGKTHTEESLRKMSIGLKGKLAGDKHPLYGIGHTEETKRKMSESQKGKNKGTNAHNHREVDQYTITGEYIKTWDYIRQVEEVMGQSCYKNVGACCNGRPKQCGGYVWRYKGDAFDKYDVVPKPSPTKCVVQYSRSGDIIAKWDSATDAGKALHISNGDIGSVCRGKIPTAGNYVWRYLGDGFYKFSIEPKSPIKKPVVQFEKDGQFIREWESATKAGNELGISKTHIRECCAGRMYSSGGYAWLFKSDFDDGKHIRIYTPKCGKDHWCYGKTLNAKEKQRMSDINKIAIIQLTLEGDFIKEWDSSTNASKYLGVDNSCISKCCKGKTKYSANSKWMYLSDYCKLNPSYVPLLDKAKKPKQE